MDGIIIIAIIGAVAFFSPESKKEISKDTKKELQLERPQRTPNQIVEEKELK